MPRAGEAAERGCWAVPAAGAVPAAAGCAWGDFGRAPAPFPLAGCPDPKDSLSIGVGSLALLSLLLLPCTAPLLLLNIKWAGVITCQVLKLACFTAVTSGAGGLLLFIFYEVCNAAGSSWHRGLLRGADPNHRCQGFPQGPAPGAAARGASHISSPVEPLLPVAVPREGTQCAEQGAGGAATAGSIVPAGCCRLYFKGSS